MSARVLGSGLSGFWLFGGFFGLGGSGLVGFIDDRWKRIDGGRLLHNGLLDGGDGGFFNRGSHRVEIEIENEKEKMDMIMDLRRLSEIFGVRNDENYVVYIMCVRTTTSKC